MRILSIDTSSSAGSMVVAEDEKILGEVNIDSAVTHSVRLLNGVDYLLKSLGLLPRDMDAFGVISGPGHSQVFVLASQLPRVWQRQRIGRSSQLQPLRPGLNSFPFSKESLCL